MTGLLSFVLVVLILFWFARALWRQAYSTFAPSEVAARKERWGNLGRKLFGP